LEYIKGLRLLTAEIDQADIILLPFSYEVVYDYSPQEYVQYGLDPKLKPVLDQVVMEADALSVDTNKKLLVFFYRDPDLALPFRNALVFRTSTRKQFGRLNEWGMPAFIDHLNVPDADTWQPRSWHINPTISFWGQSAPLRMSLYQRGRGLINDLLKMADLPWQLSGWTTNYRLRRKALISLQQGAKAGQLNLDMDIQPAGARQISNYELYQRQLLNSDYVLCVAGHGNYSFRLYEVMRAGRIPIIVDTDQLLPCTNEIDWQQVGLWLKPEELGQLSAKLLAYHQSLRPLFEYRQQQNRDLYQKYLTTEGFYATVIDKLSNMSCS
jgi:hypothetical protein